MFGESIYKEIQEINLLWAYTLFNDKNIEIIIIKQCRNKVLRNTTFGHMKVMAQGLSRESHVIKSSKN